MNDEIKAISTETVHKICSGQVIISLAIAVKELVENAIDAGAKSIEIRVKNYGLDAIEVTDNGSGVKETNFAAMTLKHYTSKIRRFDDLENVATLGFRGEALSSLCAIADITILTRHNSSEYGTKLQYDHNGHIKEQSMCARTVGTTVQLTNLFYTLPVRRKDFTRNHKKEFNKMCSLLYGYCLVANDVKFTCSNQVGSNRNNVLATQGRGSVVDNINLLFGTKQTANLIEVELVGPDEDIAADFFLTKVPDESPFEFAFHVSSVMHGCGRSAPDRQFYYINSRPCDHSKLAKVVNKCYRMHNLQQYPFVYLNIKVLSSLVDVNVTPDKRQIFLEQEKLLLATVQMSLLQAFKNFPSSYTVQNISQPILSDECNKRKFDNAEDDQTTMKSFLQNFRKKSRSSGDALVEEKIIKCPVTPRNMRRAVSDFASDRKPLQRSLADYCKRIASPINEEASTESKNSTENLETIQKTTMPSTSNADANTSATSAENLDDSELHKLARSLIETIQKPPTPPKAKLSLANVTFDSPDELTKDNSKNAIVLNFTMDSIREAVAKKEALQKEQHERLIKFRTDISPSRNKEAEAELTKQFSKSDFKKMDIIGQFNYGFIIAALDHDLFIIDQHASDEKYNFEMLQRDTVIESQKLLHPKSLQLSSVDECILLENEKIFNKNGFYIEHDPNAPPLDRVKLTKIPLSKSTIFGKDDIDEMLYMLKEGANQNCRPSRIRGMFASRACRKSVMIGKALNKPTMKQLVDHMGDIEQPWSCPHGRPTMRHLINLDLIN